MSENNQPITSLDDHIQSTVAKMDDVTINPKVLDVGDVFTSPSGKKMQVVKTKNAAGVDVISIVPAE